MHYLVGLAIFDAGIKVLFIFTHDHDVHAGMLCFDKRMIRNARPHVGVEAEGFAHGDVETLVTSTLRRRNWGLKKNSGVPQRGPGARINSGSISGEINLFTDLDFFNIHLGTRFLQDVERGFHDFRTDAVAIGDCDWYGGHKMKCLSFRFEKLTNISQKVEGSKA